MHGLYLIHHLCKYLPPPSIIIIKLKTFSYSTNANFSKNSYYYTNLLQSHSTPKTLNQIHTQIVTAGHSSNPFIITKLVSKYADINEIGVARQVFDQISERDVFLWNVMIKGYADAGPQVEAVSIYNGMRMASVELNCYTFPFVLKACAAIGDKMLGSVVHAHTLVAGFESNVFVKNALVAFYAKSGEIGVARKLFDGISVKDLVSWNSMIAGYAQNDRFQEALGLLRRMLRDHLVKPDYVTLITILPACAALSAVNEGMWVHVYALTTGRGNDVGVAGGLISMYANCGRLEVARILFDRFPERNIVLYNTMIHAYGKHGYACEAVEVFSEMLRVDVEPDDICFVCLLSACSHSGLVDKGLEIFEIMERCGVQKRQVHYAVIVDLLGRSGKLNQALEFIKGMPMEPNKDVWGALLGSCRIWKDVELAEEAAKRLFVLDPGNGGRYAILANMYEDVGRWEDAARVRKAMRDRGVRKPLGCSMVEVDTDVHTFGVEDESHFMRDEIYDVLSLLQGMVKEDKMEGDSD